MLNFYRFNHFQHYNNLFHAVTTKSKQSPYEGSLALHTGEKISDIIKNRHDIVKDLNKDDFHFMVANQTHSNHIHIIDTYKTKGWEDEKDAIQDCDALITHLPNIMLTILTADCVPILLYDKEKQVIAAVHAGWKGTHLEIVSKTVQKMIDTFGCNTTDIIAGIAPSIGSCCYEVGYDVAQHFSEIPYSYTKKNDKYMLDLPYINKKQLLDMHIPEENIEMSNTCTACEVDRFFSYRKEKGCSGRFMSMLGLKEI